MSGGADVPHRRAQTADELVDEIAQRTLVGHAALDPLRDELLDVADPFLEIAVLGVGAGLHGADGAHAPILLEALPLVEHDFARTLVDAGQQGAEHDRVGAGGDRLGDIAGILDPAIGDDRDAVAGGGAGAVEDRGDLRHADPGDDAGRADRSWPDPNLHRVGAGGDQRLGCRCGGDVAGHHLDAVRALDLLDRLQLRRPSGRAPYRPPAGRHPRRRARPRAPRRRRRLRPPRRRASVPERPWWRSGTGSSSGYP